jgi:hypothetical protein
MPNVQKTALAILCSDLHLRETAPSARAEKDWYEVMENHLNALGKASSRWGVPIVCAGDVFDRWNPSSELVRFAIQKLPPLNAIPGQHDLRYHDYESRLRGAYGCLVAAEILWDIPVGRWDGVPAEMVQVWAMPWGRWEPPTKAENFYGIKLGVLHKYAWSNQFNCHAKADESSRFERLYPNLDAMIIGDNHIPWMLPNVMNHGGFIPQNADQKSLVPHYGVLMSDGSIEKHPYDVPEPIWLESWQPQVEESKIASEVIQELQDLQHTGDSFLETLERSVDAAPPRTAHILRQMLADLKQDG